MRIESAASLGLIEQQLTAWANVERDGARVSAIEPMPGNSGLGYSFTIDLPSPHRLVIRLAPPGVRRHGNTDVLRQVALLDALVEHGVPVAPVVWSRRESTYFGTDAFVQEYVDARPLHLTDEELSVQVDQARVPGMLDAAIDQLAAVHALDWADALPTWEAPHRLADDLEFWTGLLRRCEDAALIDLGERLVRKLAQSAPGDDDPGIYHGDFQTNNVLYEGSGDVRAIVDWELSGVGAREIDVAWMSMFVDPSCWADDYAAAMRVTHDPIALFERYESTRGAPLRRLAWFRAYALLRFACISAFNLRLHRTGRRPDSAWEDMAASIPVQLERGLELAREEG